MTQNNNSISKALTGINTHIENLKLNSNTPTVSNAKIISILYVCRCLGRCDHDKETCFHKNEIPEIDSKRS